MLFCQLTINFSDKYPLFFQTFAPVCNISNEKGKIFRAIHQIWNIYQVLLNFYKAIDSKFPRFFNLKKIQRDDDGNFHHQFLQRSCKMTAEFSNVIFRSRTSKMTSEFSKVSFHSRVNKMTAEFFNVVLHSRASKTTAEFSKVIFHSRANKITAEFSKVVLHSRTSKMTAAFSNVVFHSK